MPGQFPDKAQFCAQKFFLFFFFQEKECLARNTA